MGNRLEYQTIKHHDWAAIRLSIRRFTASKRLLQDSKLPINLSSTTLRWIEEEE